MWLEVRLVESEGRCVATTQFQSGKSLSLVKTERRTGV